MIVLYTEVKVIMFIVYVLKIKSAGYKDDLNV